MPWHRPKRRQVGALQGGVQITSTPITQPQPKDLVVIFQNKFLVPKGDVTALPDILSQFQTSVAWIVTGGFSLSVVLILVSALCYDYSCRFRWKDGHRYSLLRKGLELDIWAWYAFTVSLILSIALVSPLLCILINAGYGFLLLLYYFFPYPKSKIGAIE
jgi:hypothetical protein